MRGLKRHGQAAAVVLAALAAAGLGLWGYHLHFGGNRSFGDIAYFVLYLFVVESGEAQGPVPWQLAAARWLAAGVAFWAVMRTALVLFGERLTAARPGRWEDHVVVCGLGRKGRQLALEFREAGMRVAVIERDANNPHVAACRERGVVVFIGDSSDEELLARAGANNARHVFAVTGDDGQNVAIAMKLHRLCRDRRARRSAPTTCVVHMTDLHLCEVFKQHSVFLDETDRLDVRVFNIYEHAARMLLAEHPLEGDAPDGAPLAPHLVLLGFGMMGQGIALQAAKTAHYATGPPLRVTVVDHAATLRGGAFLGAYPQFSRTCRLELVAAEITSAETIERIVAWAREPGFRVTLAVCLDGEGESLAAGMRIAAGFRGDTVPVYVRMAEATGLAALFEDGGTLSGWMECLRPYAMICRTCSTAAVLEEELDVLARAVQEGFIAAQKGGRAADDPSLAPWERLDPVFRDSCRQQADHIPVKLRAVGCLAVPMEDPRLAVVDFPPEEVELMARMEHARWNAERWLGGWTLGPKDAVRRTNPHILPWEELTPGVQDWDRNAVRGIPGLLERVGKKVVRR
ncbi:MAG TPA: NAD-binding protein [Candidatus Hydrogenedentes bacterium]|nr:NAD-binding protein [Candidatus Hydrogenedentota bacterium]